MKEVASIPLAVITFLFMKYSFIGNRNLIKSSINSSIAFSLLKTVLNVNYVNFHIKNLKHRDGELSMIWSMRMKVVMKFCVTFNKNSKKFSKFFIANVRWLRSNK